jgi:hypothetical protein
MSEVTHCVDTLADAVEAIGKSQRTLHISDDVDKSIPSANMTCDNVLDFISKA